MANRKLSVNLNSSGSQTITEDQGEIYTDFSSRGIGYTLSALFYRPGSGPAYKVWGRSISLVIPNGVNNFDVSAYIKDQNKFLATDIYISLPKGSTVGRLFFSNSLPGSWNVTFTNYGAIQGSIGTYGKNGGNALEFHRQVKFINEGSIWSGGGHGGTGRQGAKGTNGPSRVVNYKVVDKSWSAMSRSIGGKYKDGRAVDLRHGPWRLYGVCDRWLKLTSPCGTHNAGCTCSFNRCGVRVYTQNKNRRGKRSRYIRLQVLDAGYTTKSKSYTIAGGGGGRGGDGGKGGNGAGWKNSAAKGGAGGAGGHGGGRNSVVLSGTRYYGYYGKKGATGETGGPGGTWGVNGHNSGKGGSAGRSNAGYSITGTKFLISGSHLGGDIRGPRRNG